MKFKKLSPLGDPGGQADVWLGEDESGEKVALKYLRVTIGANEADTHERARFAREVKCMTTLKHLGIMRVIASNLEASQPFFVMPLAKSSLRSILSQAPNGLAEDLGLKYFSEILAAVHFAHSEGVIHRDLKPENVLIMDDGWNGTYATVSDFGLGRRFVSGSATLTQTNVGFGTFGYSAPEQFYSAHAADERSDVYALGCVLYEILVGKPLFATRDVELAPAKFRYLIHRSTKHEPVDRYESVSDMQREFTLLGEDANLQAPSELARTEIAAILSGDTAAPGALVKTLLAGSDDLELYLQILTYCPAPVLKVLALRYRDEYRDIIDTYCLKAAGGHPWTFTDKIADFLEAVFNSTADLHVQEEVLERLLILGADHNRWYVGNKFVRVAISAMKNPQIVPVIQRLLRADGGKTSFVRDQLLAESIPLAVRNDLAA